MVPLSSFLAILIGFLHLLAPSQSQNGSFFYEACEPKTCGNVTVAFPFSSSDNFCCPLGFEISCDRPSFVPTLALSKVQYQVKDIHRNEGVIILSDPQIIQDLRSNTCDGLEHHFLPAVNFTPLHLPWWGINVNFSFCRHGDLPLNFTEVAVNYSGGCDGNGSLYALNPFNSAYDGDSELPAGCSHAALPAEQAILRMANFTARREDLFNVLTQGFPLQWTNFTECWDCEKAGGRCGYNRISEKFECLCNNECNQGGYQGTSRSGEWKVIVAAAVPTTLILIAGLVAFIKFRASALSIFNKLRVRSMNRNANADVEEFMKSYRSMLPAEFSGEAPRRRSA